MYEVHGWFGLSESTYEADDGGLREKIEEIERRVESFPWPNVVVDVRVLNGQYYLMINALVNRRRDEAAAIEDLIELVRRGLPGSWGLLYERDDHLSDDDPPGPNAYQVTVLARGELAKRSDPFLSPCRPVIED